MLCHNSHLSTTIKQNKESCGQLQLPSGRDPPPLPSRLIRYHLWIGWHDPLVNHERRRGRRSQKKQTGSVISFIYLSACLNVPPHTRGICSPSPPPERQTTAGWFRVRANNAVWPDMSGLGEADHWRREHHFVVLLECASSSLIPNPQGVQAPEPGWLAGSLDNGWTSY